MEIRSSFCFIFINCVLIQYLETKSVSLNKLIAAETDGNQVTEKALPNKVQVKFADPEVEPNTSHETISAEESKLKRRLKKPTTRKLKGLIRRLSLKNKRLAAKTKLRKLIPENLRIEKLSPLNIRKAFEIKSPLRPKKLKLRHKRKNQSRKREISGNEHLKEKYVPILKGLSMLFDNLLDSDASDTYEVKPNNYKHYQSNSDKRRESLYDSNEPNPRITKSRTRKKATTPAPAISSKVSSNTQSLPANKNHDYSSNRPNKSVPVLLPRNTFSFRRDYNGPSKRSGTTHHGDVERNITRDHRNNEHNTRYRTNESREESHKNYSYSTTRDDASNGLSRTNGNRYNTRISKDGKAVDEGASKDENTNDRLRKIQLETRGNKTKSENFLREPVRRLRGYVHEHKGTNDERIVSKPSEVLRTEELHEESILSATDNSTSHKRIVNKNGSLTAEDEKIRTGNETMILIERYSRNSNHSKTIGKKVPVVLIFDGYSVTRDKNGQNKVSEKTIHIQP